MRDEKDAARHAAAAFRRLGALFADPPRVLITQDDISAIETLSDAAIRSGDTQTAVKGYALALRLRSETGLHPQRRSTDA